MKRSREPEEPAPTSSPEDSSIGSPSTFDMGAAPVPKLRELDGDGTGPDAPATATALRCTLHPRDITFTTYDEYDAHYSQQHVNRCRECGKNFPSDHILGLHIEECHDSFVAAQRNKGDHTFSCFVEGCDRKCRDPAKRRRHLIDKHSYPPNFFFDVTRYGIDGRFSLLCDRGTHRRTQSKGERRAMGKSPTVDSSNAWAGGEEDSSSLPATKDEVHFRDSDMDSEPPSNVRDVEMQLDTLASSMSSLKLVPRSVSFGRGGRRQGGFARSH